MASLTYSHCMADHQSLKSEKGDQPVELLYERTKKEWRIIPAAVDLMSFCRGLLFGGRGLHSSSLLHIARSDDGDNSSRS
jgi:hypothetical protein